MSLKIVVWKNVKCHRLSQVPFTIISLPNDKILNCTKLKAFAEDKLDVAKIMFFVNDTVENIVGKGENAGYQHFLLFPQCFQKVSFSGTIKVGIVG